jgi:hypothetical protein
LGLTDDWQGTTGSSAAPAERLDADWTRGLSVAIESIAAHARFDWANRLFSPEKHQINAFSRWP